MNSIEDTVDWLRCLTDFYSPYEPEVRDTIDNAITVMDDLIRIKSIIISDLKINSEDAVSVDDLIKIKNNECYSRDRMTENIDLSEIIHGLKMFQKNYEIFQNEIKEAIDDSLLILERLKSTTDRR